MDEFDDSGSSDGLDVGGLISSLASNATQAYETTQALNANPLNTALVYGGTAQTAQGFVASQPSTSLGTSAVPSMTGTGWLLLLLAGGALIFVAARR